MTVITSRRGGEIVELDATLSATAAPPEHPGHDCSRRRHASAAGYAREFLEQIDAADELGPGVDHAGAARTPIALVDGLQTHWPHDRDSADMAAEVPTPSCCPPWRSDR